MTRFGLRVLLVTAPALVALIGAAGSLAPAPMPAPSRQTAPQVPMPTDGAGLFQRKCGYCHLAGGTGTMMLTRRLGADNGLVAERRDLSADYVRTVVRSGIGSMPALTRVEVEDQQLGAIASWLAQGARRNRGAKK